jgi:Ni,Fe-hydrogenase III large subunit
MATSLAFIKTADLEAIAQFATGMAEIQVDQVIALADAIREVADAMTEVPTVKAIALTATMQTAAVASQAAQILAGQRPQERAGTNAQATVANNNNQSTRPIDVNITLELDGDVLDRRIVRVNKNSQSSGGALSAIEQILG